MASSCKWCVWWCSIISILQRTCDAGCPYNLEALSFAPVLSACSNANYAGSSCCRHISALIGVAASQYSNFTGLLSLPKEWSTPCLDAMLASLDAHGVPPALSRNCGIRPVVTGLHPQCSSAQTIQDVRRLAGFDKVVSTCADTSRQCSSCYNTSKKFALSLSSSHSSYACRDAVFLALASLGNAVYAMDKAACLYHLRKQQEEGCPFQLKTWQVQNVASVCMNNADSCCSFTLLTLRIAAAKVAKGSGSFFIPDKQARACIGTLRERLGDQASNYSKTCTLLPQNLFADVKKRCNGIATMSELEDTLTLRKVNWSNVITACNTRSCGECRKAAMAAAYAAAWPSYDPGTLQSCMDLAFLMLAAISSTTRATVLSSCFYALPVFVPHDKNLGKASPPALPPVEQEEFTLPLHSATMPVLAVSIAIACSALALVLVLALHVQRRRTTAIRGAPCFTFRQFEYREIQQATGNFSDIIGENKCGPMYRAILKDGLVAAVNRCGASLKTDEQFIQDAKLHGRLHHRHLVTVLGFCIHKCQRFVVSDYDYSAGATLQDYLHNGKLKADKLDWKARLNIATAVAAALDYLHCYCQPALCHGSIESSNVLLDEELGAKLAASTTSNRVEVSSSGFTNPEWDATGSTSSSKSDVYSYGVLLLELVTGKRGVYKGAEHSSDAWRLFGMLDPRLERQLLDANEVSKVVKIAQLCTLKGAESRPSMGRVLALLREVQQQTTSAVSRPSSTYTGVSTKYGNKDEDEDASLLSIPSIQLRTGYSSGSTPLSPVSLESD